MKNTKRLLAVLLSVALLISCVVLPVAANAEEGEPDVWDGTKVAPADSDSDGVYEINTPEELAWVVNSGSSSNFKLMNDIVLNDIVVKIEEGVGVIYEADGETLADTSKLTPWTSGSFKGTLDGNGHVVRGIYISASQESYSWDKVVAFIKSAESANTVIENLGIEDSYISHTNGAVGGFIGNVQHANAKVRNSYLGSSVYLAGQSGGGIFGSGSMGNFGPNCIENCYVLATINCTGTRWGAFYGETWSRGNNSKNMSIKNFYSSMRLCGESDKSGWLTITNSYDDVTATSGYVGAIADGNTMNLGDAFYAVKGDLPKLKVFAEQEVYWGGFRDSDLEGNGTSDDPYLVYTPEELAYAVNTTENKVFQLQNDIVLNDITVKIEEGVGVIYDANDNKLEDYSVLNTWASGAFPGTIDGNGHVVRGMYFSGAVANPTSETDWKNCFAFIKTAADTTLIENLGLEDSYVRYEGGTATGFVGYIHCKAATIRNSYVGSSVYLEGYNVGGLFGSGEASGLPANAATNCYVTATLNGTGASTRWGALYGDIWSVKSCSMSGIYSTSPFSSNGDPSFLTHSYHKITETTGYIGSIHDGNTMYLGDAYYAVDGEFPKLKAFLKDDIAWGGLLENKYAGGSGTADDPYQVSTPGQLAYMVYSYGMANNVKIYYELVNDIVVTDLDVVDWSTGEVKEGLDYTPAQWIYGTANGGASYKGISGESWFQGTVNGNGYKVSGIYYEPYYEGRDIETEGKWPTCVGLVPATANNSISNIMLTDSYIAGGRFSGGISAYSSNSSLNNLVVADTVTVVTTNVGKEHGYVYNNNVANYESYSAAGVVGYSAGTLNMDNCGTSAKIVCAGHLNGLVGTQWNTTVNLTNSYCVGYSPIATAGGGGTNNITNVYADVTAKADPSVTALETAQITGKNALANMDGLDTNFWYGVSGQGPLPYAYGARIVDINRDGKFEKNSEADALRVAIITGDTSAYFADRTDDGFVDIFDLVTFVK